ncbi:MAG: hypothetical protein KDD45_10190, partial [Bdellovibrionales bacterium]|nr:hypothetical protein [Bdellovibrionales bacterium]
EEVHLVIAAPLTHKEIVNLLEKLQTVKIIDWRGDDKLNLPGKEYFHLSDLKNLLAESEESLNQKVELVRQEIVNLIEKFKKKVQLNPWGWDDICA